MTDQPDREERVRRLLSAASAGPPPRVPDDVAARLDAELVRLHRERSAETPPTALRERRRRWPAILAAAALVCVVGVGVGTVLDQRDQGGDSALSSEAGVSSQGRAEDSGGQAPGDIGAESLDGSARGRQALPALHRDTLRADVQRVVARDLAATLADPTATLPTSCDRPDVGPGATSLGVRLDGAPAVLVLHPAENARRTAEVFSCADGDRPVATVTVDDR